MSSKSRLIRLESRIGPTDPYIVQLPVIDPGDPQMYRVYGEDFTEEEFYAAGYDMKGKNAIHIEVNFV